MGGRGGLGGCMSKAEVTVAWPETEIHFSTLALSPPSPAAARVWDIWMQLVDRPPSSNKLQLNPDSRTTPLSTFFFFFF